MIVESRISLEAELSFAGLRLPKFVGRFSTAVISGDRLVSGVGCSKVGFESVGVAFSVGHGVEEGSAGGLGERVVGVVRNWFSVLLHGGRDML